MPEQIEITITKKSAEFVLSLLEQLSVNAADPNALDVISSVQEIKNAIQTELMAH